jgi:predicted Zn-dependent protease
MKVTSHFEKYSRSRCKVASGARLWCGTCHDPHVVPEESEKANYFQKKCLQCHRDRACAEKIAVRLTAGDNCIVCHMPRNPVADVQHVAYTDHSIPRRRDSRRAQVDTTNCLIESFAGAAETERDLALAYAQLAIEEENPACQERAFALLRKVEPGNPRDPAVLVQLAYLYDRRSMEREAISLYERALEVDPSQITAAINLGAALSKQGRSSRAMLLWKDVLARSPGSEAASLNLASAQIRGRDAKSAQATLRRALRLSPGSMAIRKLLDELRRTAP